MREREEKRIEERGEREEREDRENRDEREKREEREREEREKREREERERERERRERYIPFELVFGEAGFCFINIGSYGCRPNRSPKSGLYQNQQRGLAGPGVGFFITAGFLLMLGITRAPTTT